jgi:hypothetical protein
MTGRGGGSVHHREHLVERADQQDGLPGTHVQAVEARAQGPLRSKDTPDSAYIPLSLRSC